MRVLMIRHAESEDNVQMGERLLRKGSGESDHAVTARLYGPDAEQTDWDAPLSAQGHVQAEQLAACVILSRLTHRPSAPGGWFDALTHALGWTAGIGRPCWLVLTPRGCCTSSARQCGATSRPLTPSCAGLARRTAPWASGLRSSCV